MYSLVFWCYYNKPMEDVSLCVGRSKGKVGIHFSCIPEKRDKTEIYPGKVMHIHCSW